MEDMVSSLSTYGYIALFLYSLGGGMVGIIAAGVLSYSGKMDITTSIFIAFIANAIGDSILFYIGRNNKQVMMPYIKKYRRKFALSVILMKKYGDKMVFIQKFIYGVKTLVPIAMGITKYSQVRFNILNFISAFIWSVILGYGSFRFGRVFEVAINTISTKPWIMPLVLIALVLGVYAYLAKFSKKNKSL